MGSSVTAIVRLANGSPLAADSLQLYRPAARAETIGLISARATPAKARLRDTIPEWPGCVVPAP